MDNIDGRITRAPISRRKRTDEQLCDRVSVEYIVRLFAYTK